MVRNGIFCERAGGPPVNHAARLNARMMQDTITMDLELIQREVASVPVHEELGPLVRLKWMFGYTRLLTFSR